MKCCDSMLSGDLEGITNFSFIHLSVGDVFFFDGFEKEFRILVVIGSQSEENDWVGIEDFLEPVRCTEVENWTPNTNQNDAGRRARKQT